MAAILLSVPRDLSAMERITVSAYKLGLDFVLSESLGYVFHLSLGRQLPPWLRSRYDVVCELGKGGFSVVMKGLSRDDGELYAIKIIKAGQMTTEISREISILKQLDHPNICRLKEVVHEEGDSTISAYPEPHSLQKQLIFHRRPYS